jgi:tetratricopeptide (TPR) repeat protein
MDNIEDLKQRIEKDPRSTLFVPLAEEYRKAGQVEEAINVLKEGIERQPGYMSARVALAKIYLERDMIQEAKVEFEKVITVIPDNLFAQKKLAEIYIKIGSPEKAIAQYRMVLELNPLDEEALEAVRKLEGGETGEEAAPDVEVAEEISALDEAVSSGDMASVVEETPLAEELEAPEEVPTFEIDEEVPTFEIDEEVPVVESMAAGEPDIAEEAPGEVPAEPAVVPGEDLEAGTWPVADEPGTPVLGFTEADDSITVGDYMRAYDIYNKMLVEEPGDRKIIQRLDELKSLLKVLGRGNEILETKLRDFLERIKARENEFFGSS